MDLRELVIMRIRRARREAGITQAEAAARAGISQKTWASYEVGRVGVGIDDLQRVAVALGKEPEWFIAPEPGTKTTPDEDALLAGYRSLSAEDRARLIEILQVFEGARPPKARRGRQPSHQAGNEAEGDPASLSEQLS